MAHSSNLEWINQKLNEAEDCFNKIKRISYITRQHLLDDPDTNGELLDMYTLLVNAENQVSTARKTMEYLLKEEGINQSIDNETNRTA